MDNQIASIFHCPYALIKISNWENIKLQLLRLFEAQELVQYCDNEALTSYGTKLSPGLSAVVQSIFNEELKMFSEMLDAFNDASLAMPLPKVSLAWFERAMNSQSHPVHNHGQSGYSAVCYVEFDKTAHKGTTLISPFPNIQNGHTMSIDLEVDEGCLIFFPSFLLHYSKHNLSTKQRTILSFNLVNSFI